MTIELVECLWVTSAASDPAGTWSSVNQNDFTAKSLEMMV
jgi:hypothetical protein